MTSDQSPPKAVPRSEPLRKTVAICNTRGLHARASAKFVKCAAAFDAQITVSRETQTVGGTSIMGLMMLAAANGSEIEIAAKGAEAAPALAALVALVENAFGED